MSSTSQALGPNEPPAPPNWVMGQPYRWRSGLMGRPGSVCPAHELSGRPPLHRAAGRRSNPGSPAGNATVVFVHGSLDRGDSFRLAMRRLPEFATLAYDRRGYQGSRGGGVVDLAGHIDDLLAIADTARAEGDGPRGGDRAQPRRQRGHRRRTGIVRGPSTPSAPSSRPCRGWAFGGAGARPWPPLADDPGEEAERFFSRMVGAGTWARLHRGRAGPATGRRAGAGGRPAQHAGRGRTLRRHRARRSRRVRPRRSRRRAPHHRRGVEWLGANVPGAVVYEIAKAQHGAHLSHPDHFAAMARLVVERARAATG